MSLISMEFLLFVLAAVTGYYMIPKKYQWIWLLLFSYIYYAASLIPASNEPSDCLQAFGDCREGCYAPVAHAQHRP